MNSIQSFTEKHIILQFKISKIKESSHRKYQIPKFIVHRFLLSARKLLLPSIIPPFFNLQHSFSTILSNESTTQLLFHPPQTGAWRALPTTGRQKPKTSKEGEAEVGFRRKESTPGLRRIDNAVCIKQSFYRRRRDHSPPLLRFTDIGAQPLPSGWHIFVIRPIKMKQ